MGERRQSDIYNGIRKKKLLLGGKLEIFNIKEGSKLQLIRCWVS